MAVPLQVQLFDAFLGSQEGIHSIILPDLFSSGGSKNLYIDKYGRARKILGYSKQNPALVTSNTGGATMLLRAVFPYKKNAGGTTTRVLVGVFTNDASHWEVRTSADNGVTWTFQSDVTAAIGKIPSFAQFGNNLYITNSVQTPQVWNGTTLATAGSTQSPTPASTASATAGLLLGTYQWKLVSINADGTRKYGSVASTTIALQNTQATLAWTQDADATILGYEIYRTTGTGSVYYFVDYVNGRSTAAYTDNTNDLTILQNRVMEEVGDPPPSGSYFGVPHKERIWWLRTDTFPTRAWYSDPALPDSVLTTFNYIDFSDSETVGDVITGGTGNYEGMLVIWTERAVWTVSGTGQVIGNIQDWNRTRSNAQVGAVSHRAVARVPAGSKYSDQQGKIQTTPVVTLAYFTPFGDIRLFDGDNDIVISHPLKTTLSTMNYAQRAKIFCLHDTARAEVTWCFPSGTASENSTAVTWNYRWGVWYNRDWGFAHAVEADTSSQAQLLLAGSTSVGQCYQLWSGNSFDGSAIQAQWMTKTLYGVNQQAQPALSLQKRWRWVDLLFETQQTVPLTIEWLSGNTPDNGAAWGSATITPSAAGVLDSQDNMLVDASGNTLIISQQSSLVRAILQGSTGRYLHDVGIRLRISDNSTLGQWSLESMALAYQELPGLQRRMQG